MEICFPAQTLSLLPVFAPGCTAPSVASFQRSGWALRVVEGRTWLTRLARCACGHQRHRRRWERVRAAQRWRVTAGTERLVRRVVERRGAPLQVHGASRVGTDPTRVAKTTTRLLGGHPWQAHRDTADRGASLGGHHWPLVGRRRRWDTRWRCGPLVRRRVPGRTGARPWLVGDTLPPMSCWDAASAAPLEVTRGLGQAAGRGGAAAFSSQAPVLKGLRARGSAVLSRRRQDAVGGTLPHPSRPASGAARRALAASGRWPAC
jgi:hypothetical protein